MAKIPPPVRLLISLNPNYLYPYIQALKLPLKLAYKVAKALETTVDQIFIFDE